MTVSHGLVHTLFMHTNLTHGVGARVLDQREGEAAAAVRTSWHATISFPPSLFAVHVVDPSLV